MHKKDNKLRAQVQEAIDAHPEMERYGIQADVVDGEVQLTGIVDTAAEKNRLNEIASRVPGVKRIENGITVSTDGQINDSGVAMEVTEELNAHPRVNMKNIGAKIADGKVFLVGRTDDPAEERAAIEAASKARGVTEVISRVKHKRTGDLSLEEIFHSQVRNDKED
ncbi:hyperosmotically inducible protein [Desulfohalotomaculum tongense]|uniref:BON domain-containing protein n=1 Tax=Desulforadius tongensis TaxID=1216062 RepID=UPI00195F0EC9|nr:BON domain-containing protein [Desulforadius tongensis]MBM7855390.1 hyperosmotically inducible protein [Desulforadius tongensis]